MPVSGNSPLPRERAFLLGLHWLLPSAILRRHRLWRSLSLFLCRRGASRVAIADFRPRVAVGGHRLARCLGRRPLLGAPTRL